MKPCFGQYDRMFSAERACNACSECMPCKAERFGTLKVGDVPPKSELHGAFSVQVGGGHYKSMAIQPAEYCHRNRIGKLEGDVIAYVSRWRAKNGVEDLKKARHTLDLMIEMEERQ